MEWKTSKCKVLGSIPSTAKKVGKFLFYTGCGGTSTQKAETGGYL